MPNTGRLLLTVCCLLPTIACADYETRPQVQQFIHNMHLEHQLPKDQLNQWFAMAKKQTGVLKAIAKPAEALAWHQYRGIFLTKKRIDQGILFWKKHNAILQRAEQVYGVPPEIITSIIGIETFYGQYQGKFPAFDTLVTLAFDYPRRKAFFLRELEQYLLLIREEKLDLAKLKGSYAAALGKPQFIPSSYRHYAVDFDQDGRRDLLNNTSDVIGSVANYLKRHGWKKMQAIAIPTDFNGEQFPDFPLKPGHRVDQLSQYQIFPKQAVSPSALATPIRLTLKQGYQYWLGLHNFYVITRYNHSQLYAMAVYQLSQAIKQGY